MGWATAAKKLGRWADAAAAYEVAIAIKADFVWSYYSLAEVSEKLGKWEAAAQNYRQVLALDPSNEQAPPRLAGALQRLLEHDPQKHSLLSGAGGAVGE